MKSSPWKTVTSKTVYENKWIRIIEDKIIHPDGKHGIYAYMDAIPGVIVVVEDEKGIYFINEYNYPLKKWIWNLVTGGLGRSEDPLERAKAEVYEEMGITANNWVEIGKFYFAPAIESTYNHVFLATDLTVTENSSLGTGDEAIREVRKIPVEEIELMIKNGEIESGLVLGALMQYLLFTKK